MAQMSQSQTQLTDKDLLYIKDELGAELLLVKRYQDAMKNVTDAEIRQAFQQASNMHQEHYKRVLSHLQGTSQGQMQ